MEDEYKNIIPATSIYCLLTDVMASYNQYKLRYCH
jgi:hypothetical protein